MIRQVVFDLDGTLANTASITSARRVPADVLELCPAEGDASSISFGSAVCRLPGRLIAHGYEVMVMTRAPLAYSSTVLGLLDVDYQAIATSVGESISARADGLQKLAGRYGYPASQTLYVGDSPEDEVIARRVGCRFEHPAWVRGGPATLNGAAKRAPGRDLRPDGSARVPALGPGALDLAASRIRAGTGDITDATLLYQCGLWAVLFEYGARLYYPPRLSSRARFRHGS